MQFSFSQYQSFLTCPKKYFWQYVRRLSPNIIPKAFDQGLAFHLGVAGKPCEPASLFYQIGQLARHYFPALPGQVSEVEKIIEITPWHTVKCIADSVANDYVIEYKTMSRPDADKVAAQLLSTQLRLYAIAWSKPRILVRIARKADIRLKKSETDEQFDARYLQEYIDKPQDYFLEVEASVEKQGTIRELMHAIQLIEKCVSESIWPCNAPYGCHNGRYACTYMPLCRDEETNKMLYHEKEPKSEEGEKDASL